MQTTAFKSLPKAQQKGVMPFASYVLTVELAARGAEAFELNLPFNEREMLSERLTLICHRDQLGLEDVEIRDSSEGPVDWDKSEKSANATPGKPTVAFFMPDMA